MDTKTRLNIIFPTMLWSGFLVTALCLPAIILSKPAQLLFAEVDFLRQELGTRTPTPSELMQMIAIIILGQIKLFSHYTIHYLLYFLAYIVSTFYLSALLHAHNNELWKLKSAADGTLVEKFSTRLLHSLLQHLIWGLPDFICIKKTGQHLADYMTGCHLVFPHES